MELITEYEYIIRSIVRTFLRRIDGHDEDDLVNEVIIRAYKVIPGFRGDDAAFKYFLRRTTKGLCLNLINKPKHDLQEFKEDAQDTLPGPDGVYVSEKIRECVRKAIDLLPKKLKPVVILNDLEELQYDEIADILKLPMGTVKSRISRGREQLKWLFKELHCREML